MREFSKHEYMLLDTNLRKCGWVRGNCRIFWVKNRFGAYKACGDYIEIQDNPNMLFELTPCIVHELTHRAQRKRYGLILYSLLNLTRTKLEPEAQENEKQAEQKLGITL